MVQSNSRADPGTSHLGGGVLGGGWDRVRIAQLEAVHQSILEVVSEQGTPLEVSEICKRAKISRPTFYKYFPTLGAALLQSFRISFGQLARAGHSSYTDAVNQRTALVDRYRAGFEFASNHPEIINLISFLDYSFRRVGFSSEESNEVERLARGEASYEEALFEAGQSEGSIRADLEPRSTIGAIGSSVLGLTQRLLVTEEYNEMGEAVAAVELLLSAWDAYLVP